MIDDTFTFVPVISDNYWYIKLDEFWLNQNKIQLNTTIQSVLIDSGTSLLHFP